VLLLELPELRVDVEGPPEVTLPLLVPVLRQVAQPVEQLLALLEQVTELEDDFALVVVHASHHDHLFGESGPRPDAGWTPFSTTRSRRARVMAPTDSATLLHGAYDDGDRDVQSILLPTPHQGAQCAPPAPLLPMPGVTATTPATTFGDICARGGETLESPSRINISLLFRESLNVEKQVYTLYSRMQTMYRNIKVYYTVLQILTYYMMNTYIT